MKCIPNPTPLIRIETSFGVWQLSTRCSHRQAKTRRPEADVCHLSFAGRASRPQELLRDFIRLRDRYLFHWPKFSSTTVKCARDVEVNVADFLSSRNSIVLPYSDSGLRVGPVDQDGGVPHLDGNRGSFCISKFENGWHMSHRQNKQMGMASLFACHESGGIRGTRQYRVRALTP